MRVFIFSYRKCNGKTGGSGGVNYKLYLANAQYRIFENLYNCFQDVVIEPHSSIDIKDMVIPCNDENRIKKKIKRAIKKIGFVNIFMYEKKLYYAGKWIREINKKYGFTQSDVYILQDIESAMAFYSLFSMKYTVIVYHQQGSLYAEWEAFNGVSSRIYHSYLTNILKKAFSFTDNIAFPSKGAKDSLLASEPLLESIICNKHIDIVYNGFDKPQNIQRLSENIKERLDIISSNDKIFISVAQANYAKGVERIPLFIRKLKDRGMLCKWILVSNGEMNSEIEKKIEENELQDNVIWIKDYIAHSDILHLFSISDYYILFHRWSIFDFSTIEAMAYGNIPILTPVGGNLEVVDKEAGFLVDLDNMDASIDTIFKLSHEKVMIYKNQNIKIEAELFSFEAFINYYKKLVTNMLNIE